MIKTTFISAILMLSCMPSYTDEQKVEDVQPVFADEKELDQIDKITDDPVTTDQIK